MPTEMAIVPMQLVRQVDIMKKPKEEHAKQCKHIDGIMKPLFLVAGMIFFLCVCEMIHSYQGYVRSVLRGMMFRLDNYRQLFFQGFNSFVWYMCDANDNLV